MAIKTKLLAARYREFLDGASPIKMGVFTPLMPDDRDEAVRQAIGKVYEDLLVESLSPQQREVYEYISFIGEWFAPAEIAMEFETSATQASNVLKRLHDYGLLERREHRDQTGLCFYYRQGGSHEA